MAMQNLGYGKDAIRYVRDTMAIKASNRQLYGITQEEFTRALQIRNSCEDDLAETITEDGLLSLVADATSSVQTRIGNCKAMAALAAAYLAARGVFPLRQMSFYGGDKIAPKVASTPITGAAVAPNAHTYQLKPGRTGSGGNDDYARIAKFEPDHAVCVIGPVSGPPTKLVWGADTVICDPWARRAYFATELAEESRLIASVTGGFKNLTIDAELAGAEGWNTDWNPPGAL